MESGILLEGYMCKHVPFLATCRKEVIFIQYDILLGTLCTLYLFLIPLNDYNYLSNKESRLLEA